MKPTMKAYSFDWWNKRRCFKAGFTIKTWTKIDRHIRPVLRLFGCRKFQLEEGNMPTSFVPTNNNIVTRAADVITLFDGEYNSYPDKLHTNGLLIEKQATNYLLHTEEA